MVPTYKDVVILSVGSVQTTPNGNRFVECRTHEGRLAVWLAPHSPALELLTGAQLPLTVETLCLPDRQTPDLLWVPESAPLILKGA